MIHPYTFKDTPFIISPEDMDWYLARGWYRMGNYVFTSHYLYFNNQPYSAIWIRFPLQGYSFSKSQRKLMRRNEKHFDIQIGKRVIDEEREDLYAKYAEDFDGKISESISENLADYSGDTLFNTHEITVRDKISGKLVAISYFDLGRDSAASILGIYDPKLHTFSLGYYTMLLELQFCLDNQMKYYYPGYIVPGYPRFDYKKRLGAPEYYDLLSNDWLPLDDEKINANGPVEVIARQLKIVDKLLTSRGSTQHKVVVYPYYEANLFYQISSQVVPYPYFIYLKEKTDENIWVVVFDLRGNEFIILDCRLVVPFQALMVPSEVDYCKLRFNGILLINSIVFRSTKAEAIVDFTISHTP